ncbi:uncharacterized protein ACA1_386540 [Acanthamoeba castellanii str. Neff]|uniref:Uncharacterized protein n=1 Tax=Acanthamoeba castellanii (strain ATCC 30010 / Neff) TaxID=1257118 RepID=L8H9I2_ACACF|nr:uncharacterized protein ACA1_386540 [Acanthamoeba castellanii str. Neff]ELR21845.1 hypothetical protein ACA1_386540 [Acanthamoeba castellanii str. Neff]
MEQQNITNVKRAYRCGSCGGSFVSLMAPVVPLESQPTGPIDVNQAFLLVWLGSAQNIPGDGTYAPILAWSLTGSLNLAAGPVVVTTGKYMVAFASQYEVGAAVTFAALGANNAGQRSIQIILKRSTNTYIIMQDTKQPSANLAIPMVLYTQTLGNFITGDEIWVQASQTSTVALPLAIGVATKFHVQPCNGASTA